MYIARALRRDEDPDDKSRFGRMGVFRVLGGHEEQIGMYERNYGTAFNTFFPFQQNGKDLALYSPDYTSTRIMELPSCVDLGGEERDEMGFCPVDYFVPTYIDVSVVTNSTNDAFPDTDRRIVRINNPRDENLRESSSRHEYVNGNTGQECVDVIINSPLSTALFYPFGFVAGCIWGDESSWKVQFLDLSDADQGVLVREERFGYIELPENVNLKDAINMYDYGYDSDEDDSNHIRINVMQTFDLRTGKVIHPFD